MFDFILKDAKDMFTEAYAKKDKRELRGLLETMLGNDINFNNIKSILEARADDSAFIAEVKKVISKGNIPDSVVQELNQIYPNLEATRLRERDNPKEAIKDLDEALSMFESGNEKYVDKLKEIKEKADNSKASSRQRYYQSYISAKNSEKYVKMFDTGKLELQVNVPTSSVKPKSSYTIEDFLLYCDEVLGRKQIFTTKVDVSKLKRYTELAIKLSKDSDDEKLIEEFTSLSREIEESGLQLSRDTITEAEKEAPKLRPHKDFKEGALIESKTPKFKVKQLPKKPLLINPSDVKSKKFIEDVYIQSGVNYILASDVKILLLTGENLFSDINTTAQATAEGNFKMELDNQIKRRLQIYLSNIEGKNESETANERESTVERIANSLVNKWGRQWAKDEGESFVELSKDAKKDLFSEEGPMDYDELISALTSDVERVIEEDLNKPMDDVLQGVELEEFVEEANVKLVDTENDLMFDSIEDFKKEVVDRQDKEQPLTAEGKPNYLPKIGVTSKYDILDTIATIADMSYFFTGNFITAKLTENDIFKTLKDGKVDLNELEPVLKKYLDEIKRAIIDGMQDKMKEIIEEHRHFYRATRIRRGYQKRAGGVGEIAGEDAYTGMRETLVGEKKGIIKTLLEIKLLEE
jgi:hypothetical protein